MRSRSGGTGSTVRCAAPSTAHRPSNAGGQAVLRSPGTTPDRRPPSRVQGRHTGDLPVNSALTPGRVSLPRSGLPGRPLDRALAPLRGGLAAIVVLVPDADLVAEPHQRVVLLVGHALLHRDDGV